MSDLDVTKVEVCNLDWHVTPFRTDRWFEAWQPAAARCLSFGATSWTMTRSIDDPLAFRQSMVWANRSDFERYWYSEEITTARTRIIDLYDKVLLPAWYTLLVSE